LAQANGIMSHVCNQVNVIGHHNKTASEPMVTLWAVEQERDEALERVIVVENAGSPIHTDCQEI